MTALYFYNHSGLSSARGAYSSMEMEGSTAVQTTAPLAHLRLLKVENIEISGYRVDL